MKKTLLAVRMLLGLSLNGFAILTIDTIEIVQAQDFLADWNPTRGSLEWKPDSLGGAELYASATLRRSDGAEFEADVKVHANFTGLTDLSSGGWASGSFATVSDWDIIFFDTGVMIGKIEGTGILGNAYTEIEGVEAFPGFYINPDNLYGNAVVMVTETDFTHWGASWKDETGGEAKMESWMVLPTGANFGSYAQSYTTNLTTLWLNADETVIPEPATLALLGLGGLLLRKRRV